ncbi:MAG: hypothetical protein ACLQSR_10605 [Limisphaerales bacterium]
MNEPPKTKSGWRVIRRILIGLAVLATLIAIFYTEEDWRGKRAWENCKRNFEAQGENLDWNAYISPPVPDDQNFFKAPKMQWFVRNTTGVTNELSNLITNTQNTATITDKTVAANFLAWSDQFESDFDLMREALKRPDTRMEGDYTVPSEIPIVNFIHIRAVAQVLAQRAKCYLLLGEPEKALSEVTLLNDSRRMLEHLPTGQPMTLVDAMVNVAVTGLYVDTITYGFQRGAWQEPQLAVIQEQLAQINLAPLVARAFGLESVAMPRTIEKSYFVTNPYFLPNETLWDRIKSIRFLLIPRGWFYQNIALIIRLAHEEEEGFDLTHNLVLPRKFADLNREITALSRHPGPYTFLAAEVLPNVSKAAQVLAHNQTKVNEAQITCALERFHQVYGTYPGSLDALVPHFIEVIPHDIIDGGPLIYHPTADRKFLLYSIGWDEKDDGGQKEKALANGQIDLASGDWVWEN